MSNPCIYSKTLPRLATRRTPTPSSTEQPVRLALDRLPKNQPADVLLKLLTGCLDIWQAQPTATLQRILALNLADTSRLLKYFPILSTKQRV